MRKRRRGLSEEEAALWRSVRQSVRPLKPGKPLAALAAATQPPPSPIPPPAPAPAPPAIPRLERRVTLDLAPDPAAAVTRAHPHMDRRRFGKLRRGKLEPEAHLDLHGMTRIRAHDELVRFLIGAHAAGLRLVLVITGKGRSREPERPGVLRHSLPHWLDLAPLAGRILEVAPAHHRHGGAGAFYIYLRRSRDAPGGR